MPFTQGEWAQDWEDDEDGAYPLQQIITIVERRLGPEAGDVDVDISTVCEYVNDERDLRLLIHSKALFAALCDAVLTMTSFYGMLQGIGPYEVSSVRLKAYYKIIAGVLSIEADDVQEWIAARHRSTSRAHP